MLVGDQGLEKLKHATVLVVGCGAVGSFAIEALARSGVGNLVVIDNDNVEQSNINRQLIATNSTIGTPKVEAVATRVHDINPDINVIPVNLFWDDNTDIEIKPDWVIDAIDTVSSKVALYKWCQKNKIQFISSMGAARKTDPGQIKINKISKTTVCPLAKKIRHEIKNKKIVDFPVVFSTECADKNVAPGKEFGSIVTVTGVFGLMLANFVIQKIIQK